MNQSIPSILILATTIASLSSCVTTPTAVQMREANSALKQSAKRFKQGDFSGAHTAAAAIGRSVRIGIDLAPVVTSETGQEVPLKPMLSAWESGPYHDLKIALKGKKGEATAAAFTNLRGLCSHCHTAIGRPNIRLN